MAVRESPDLASGQSFRSTVEGLADALGGGTDGRGVEEEAASVGREGEESMVLVASVMIRHYYGFDCRVTADVFFPKSIVT